MNKLREQAEGGDVNAQYAMGKIYKEGHEVSQDYEEAMKWYMKAAVKGHCPAQCYVGWLYENGFGVPENKKEALFWYERGGAHKKIEYLTKQIKDNS